MAITGGRMNQSRLPIHIDHQHKLPSIPPGLLDSFKMTTQLTIEATTLPPSHVFKDPQRIIINIYPIMRTRYQFTV